MKQIYALIDPRSDAIRYIGFTSLKLGARMSAHLWAAKRGRGRSRVLGWIRGLLKTGLRPRIVLLEAIEDGSCWQEREIAWIALAREGGADLCNHAVGGQGRPGWIAPPEVRARMSAALKGRVIPDHVRTAISEAMRIQMADPTRRAAISAKLKGRTVPPEVVARRAAAQTGLRRSEETKAKIGAANSIALRGKTLSPETIAKRTAAVRGSKRSPEARERMRAAQRARREAESNLTP